MREFRPPCVSLDLEVGSDDRIHAIGAIRADTGRSLTYSDGGLAAALERLDDFAEGASFLLGHNLIAFDLPHLTAAKPALRLLKLPAVDTLRLSPLAFPPQPLSQSGQALPGWRSEAWPGERSRARLPHCAEAPWRPVRGAGEGRTGPARRMAPAVHPRARRRGRRPGRALSPRLRGRDRPSRTEAEAAIERRLRNAACATWARDVVADAHRLGWPLAYALAWLSVAGGNSVMPPWVRHQFPQAGRLVRRLRDTACTDPACGWCR